MTIASPGKIYTQDNFANSPLQIIQSIADKIINDTQFEFVPQFQETQLGVQIIDFKREFAGNIKGICYALSYIGSGSDSIVNLGISASPGISIWINDQILEVKKSERPSIKEIAYGMINFEDTLEVMIKKGFNKILIKSSPGHSFSKIFLRQITDNPETEGWLKFSVHPALVNTGTSGWLIIGPLAGQSEEIPEKEIKNFYVNNGNYLTWRSPKQNVIQQLKINPGNTFKKDSYVDWNYANGETILSILSVAEETANEKYLLFAKQWCDFILDNIGYFRWQYDSLNALRGSFHRIFRKSMLDDAGAPVLPFLQFYLDKKDERYYSIIEEMSSYIMNKQVRLDDGTLCRPEPVEMTVWADDLFMAVPVLIRMGNITGDKKYFEEAVRQIISFNKKLFDEKKNLYKHGWFSKTGETSIAFWGRANGWIIWALSEALLHLPKNLKEYSEIMTIYKSLVDGLIKYQDKSGMWHQVLDHPESYEETSCTAMFVLGIARGVNNKWLNESYSDYAFKGWNALTKKIEPEGIVHGICRGTGIGENLEFYFNRPTFDNDPRGLGAVLTAGIEVSKLQAK